MLKTFRFHEIYEKYSSIREIRFTPSAVDHNFSKGRDYGENISLNRQCSSSEVLTLCWFSRKKIN